MPPDPADLGPERAGPVELVVPASSSQLRLCRLVTAGVAASCGLDIDRLDDLRIAVDELCSLLIEQAAEEGSLRLLVDGSPASVRVNGTLDAPSDEVGVALDPISQQILDGLDVDWHVDAGAFRLTAPRTGGG